MDAIREKALGRGREGGRGRERKRGNKGGHHSPTLVPGKPHGAKIGAEEEAAETREAANLPTRARCMADSVLPGVAPNDKNEGLRS